MSFERARNEENKKIRFEQIKDAAKALFDTVPYHEITLSKIGKEINFTRGNLYKYISSKEDIYICIMIDEFNDVLSDMEDKLINDEKLDTKTLAHTWANVLIDHPRFLKLFSLLFTIIEQNTNIAVLVDFKNNLVSITGRMLKIFQHNLPEFTDDEIAKLFDYATSLIIARYPICYPSENQIEATRLSNYNYTFPDFIETFSEGVVLLINGMKLSKI